ncbi:P-loop containing nucleoside triphosphate hydrolase protein, partial [Mycena pura]
MSSPVTRSSILGKRPHAEPSTPAGTDAKRHLQLQTPDNSPIPKRPRTSNITVDGDGNKENVPPFKTGLSPPSPRPTRMLRRSTTSDGSPSRGRLALSRRASTSAIVPATPTAEIAQLTLTTPPPTPPNSLLPIHSRARALLRATCNSLATEMAGRDAERAAISSFFLSLIGEADTVEHTSLYISGSPGTGKTALVNSILRTLPVGQVKVIMINCMALNSIDALWERLIEELGANVEKKNRKTASRTKKLQGRETVDALLAALPNKCVIILDELDHIAPTAQSLSSLFSLSASRPSTLRVVGIANTHTLTASSSAGFVPASSDVCTLHFAPYTPAQLLQILQSRLAPLYVDEPSEDMDGAESVSQAAKKFLSPLALNLLTKKIAALTGDVRSLFEVLRGAIELTVSSAPSSPSPSTAQAEEKSLIPAVKTSVTPSHILAALKAYTPSSASASRAAAPTATNSEVVSKIRCLGLQARLVLLALMIASKRLEAGLSLSSTSKSSPVKRGAPSLVPVGGVDPTQLHAFYTAVLSRSCDSVFAPASRSEFADLVGMLEGVGLVVCGASAALPSPSSVGAKGKRAFGRSASFGCGAHRGATAGDVQLAQAVRTEEVLRGLGIGARTDADEDVAIEEVNAIWLKETAKLARDLAARDKAKKDKVTAGFDDAMED